MRLLLMGALILACAGCGSEPGKLKGRIVRNGNPETFKGQVALELTRVDAGSSGEAGPKSFTAVVNGNGSFEVHASGGEIPPGTYSVAINVVGKERQRFQQFAPGASKLKIEVKPGENDVVIDLAKPNG